MIGIIANPASGKDIRRLVAQGTVFDNMEKVNIIQRILVVLHYGGVKDIYMMPDSFHIMDKALCFLERNQKVQVDVKELDFDLNFDQTDSIKAAALLREMKASCIITLGGDGTNRAVAKGSGDVPLLPLSTGTNNVFPVMLEGSVAGLAAMVADKDATRECLALRQCKRINIYKNDELVDIALIDAVITDDMFVGSRALWETDPIKEIFVTAAKPDSIGISAIAGSFRPMSEAEPGGLYVKIGGGSFRTWAAIAPGLVRPVPIREFRDTDYDTRVRVETPCGMIALDGEREVVFNKNDKVEIEFTDKGPCVIDVQATLNAAAKKGIFVDKEVATETANCPGV
jgi:predicted polyphosphate/ATP-dependent NAD kinase